eukprot:m.152104 g.152104  ORF g.152104 m.152104 type:complete len:160 (+) comp15050_c0_seq2:1415-1894(+)
MFSHPLSDTFFTGPGLAIRVLCAHEAFMGPGYEEAENILDYITSKDKNTVSAETASNIDKALGSFSGNMSDVGATILPVRTVGVQGDGRTYSFVVCLTLSSEKIDWDKLMVLAKTIPRICHGVNRVVFAWGPHIPAKIRQVTPTLLTEGNPGTMFLNMK